VVVGQGQVADIFSREREKLGWALGIFSLSRMTAAMCGPMLGGVICKLLGWRYTFWLCAVGDAICFTISVVYVPETLLTPRAKRPTLKWNFPLKPLGERALHVLVVCIMCAVNL
jgi:predicted MFS family arabinose efflux permease